MPQHRLQWVSVLLAATIGLAACGKSDPQSKAAEIAPTSVTLIAVTPQIYEAGYFGAVSQGYFADENLEAAIRFTESTLEQGDSDVVAQVLAGNAQFGLIGADRILQARQEGQPLVAIASIYQRDPTAIIALKNKGITQPQDLLGKKILIWTNENMFRLFALKTGLDMSQITLVSPPGGSISVGSTMFITSQVDAMIANGTDAVVQITNAGIAIDTIYLNEYGVANYPNVIFTTEAMLQDNPDVVQRFVNAFVRGMQYAVRNPDAMGTWFIEHYGDALLDPQVESQIALMQAIVPLLQPPNSQPGVMNAATWQLIHDAMVEADLLEPQDFSQAYTRRFVDAYYK